MKKRMKCGHSNYHEQEIQGKAIYFCLVCGEKEKVGEGESIIEESSNTVREIYD